jgi:alkylation response protein AidB-like acyl-CoA dehydrogenase
VFSRRHKRAGKAVYDHQLVQLQLNEMHMLTETLRSFVLRTAWEMDNKAHGPNPVLVMNYSQTVVQRVTELNMAIHGADGAYMDASADKLWRDAVIWTHLAGDNTQRLKVIRRLPA